MSAEPHACSYLPGQTALTPLRYPTRRPVADEFDALLAEGDRRAGPMLYRTSCPECSACEALRIPVARFTPTKSQRRVQRLNSDTVRVEVGPARTTPAHVDLYNKHRDLRGLATDDSPLTLNEYESVYVRSCVDTREVRYLVGDRLVAVSLLDLGAKAASSVYHYFDPDEGKRSLGVYSVLREIALCADWQVDWYYLGLWVRDCSSLVYKSSYYPHQRLRAGEWTEYARVDGKGRTEGTSDE